MQTLHRELQEFWGQQMEEVQRAKEFKNHQLPLARIKKIMKCDEDVRMISAEAPVLFAKACEMFILELTLRAWAQTEEAKRRTLQRSDISAAIQKTEVFDFLIDIVPREDPKKEDVMRPVPGMAESQMAYYTMPSNMQYMPQAANMQYLPQQMGGPLASAGGDAAAAAAAAANMQIYQQGGQGVYPGTVQYPSGVYQPQGTTRML
eukprot:CAMPEP_0184677608 /NCGR_PEP_ID=MMETSP0312-20130426/184_1 /TAXON_ID=31354 /ORGANISM="Compsopogon coeruleus, Strain SAG 36.94" /LENGTH=204 /DNA_ID=CAMNT_0027125569 /DNA_START=87 /DNA_END=701 /DNA_ORIENTATION=+